MVQFNHIVTPNATYNLTFNIDWSNVDPACTSRTLELSTNGGITYTTVAFENAENTVASINFTAPATISYPVLLRFSCAGVNLTNINYTVLRSAELVNDNFKSPDVNSINTLGYEYFNETNTTPSTAELSKETVIVGGEQFKILQIDPTSGTTRLQKVYSGLEIGKTYRVAVILPRTTYNITHNGTTYPVQNTRLEDKALQVTMPNGVGIGMKDAYYAVAIPNYTFPANSKAGRGLTPDGNYHYWISFIATAPTATVTYLGASNNVFPTASSSTPGGYRLKNAGGRQILGFTLHQKIPTKEDGEEDGYRYGFNGKETETSLYNEGNAYDFGARMYDARLGRFFSLDLRREQFPMISPYCFAANSPIRYIDINGEGPGDRVKRALDLTKIDYLREQGVLRTANTKEGMQYMDCSEFVCRVLAYDRITPKVESMNSGALKKFLSDKTRFEVSQKPKVGDIAVWEGHVGIVTKVFENGKLEITHARGPNRKSATSRVPNAQGIRNDVPFYGFYRPIKENPDSDQPNNSTDNNANKPQIDPSPSSSPVTNFIQSIINKPSNDNQSEPSLQPSNPLSKPSKTNSSKAMIYHVSGG